MKSPVTPPAPPPRPAPILLAIAGLCALLEVAFLLAESPFLDLTALRRTAIMHGAFWTGLLGDWTPLFPGQSVTMFFTYAFLHAGLLHMVFNMLLVLHLGREAVARLGTWGFVLLYLLASAGGAVAFALLNTTGAPMLGASGAVFGLFGATIWWDIQRRRAARVPLEPALRLIGGLVVMNVLLWAMVGGMLAWETHLGGFLAGGLVAWAVTPTLRHRYRRRPPTAP